MQRISTAQAKRKLASLLAEVTTSHAPVHITGKDHSGVLISEEDWTSIQETLCLLAIPGMRQSIVKGIKTPVSKCSRKLTW